MSSPAGRSRLSSSSSVCSEMMHSIILDPADKPDFLKEKDYEFVELSDGDTLLGSSSDDDDGWQSVKDGDKKRRKDTTKSEKNDVQADNKPVKPSSNSKQLPPSSSFTTEWDAATDAENTASKWAAAFHSTGSSAEESDDFDHIDAAEAQDAQADERTARIERAMAIQRRRNELRRIAPAPEQIGCPCLTGGKDGWKACRVPAHVELGRLTRDNIR